MSHRWPTRVAAALLAAVAAAPASPAHAQRVQYPTTRTVEQVDDYHGTRVADPYRWLEDLDSPETASWVKSQNELTFGYLAGLPGRDALRQRLTEVWNYPRVSIPFREGGRLFFTRNTGLQRQSPYFATRPGASTIDGAALVLDPNALSPDGSVSLSMFAPTRRAATWPTGSPRGARTGGR